jgi:hypothetical protein
MTKKKSKQAKKQKAKSKNEVAESTSQLLLGIPGSD